MALDNSAVMICADSDRASVNNALSAFFGDAPNSPELSRKLCPSNVNPLDAAPTAWGGAIWLDGATATALKDWPTGVLPTVDMNGGAINWSTYGLDQASALSCGALMGVQIATGPNADPQTNLTSLAGSLNLQFVTTAP